MNLDEKTKYKIMEDKLLSKNRKAEERYVKYLESQRKKLEEYSRKSLGPDPLQLLKVVGNWGEMWRKGRGPPGSFRPWQYYEDPENPTDEELEEEYY